MLVASLLCGLLALGTAEGRWRPGSVVQPRVLPRAGLGGCAAEHVADAARHVSAVGRLRPPGRVLGDGRHLGAVIIGSTLIGLASLVLLPHPVGWHPPGLTAARAVRAARCRTRADGNNESAPRSAQNYMRGAIDLNSRGELSRTRLVSVPADSPDLWAASVLYTYEGSFWGPSRALRHQAFRVPTDSAGDFDLRTGSNVGRHARVSGQVGHRPPNGCGSPDPPGDRTRPGCGRAPRRPSDPRHRRDSDPRPGYGQLHCRLTSCAATRTSSSRSPRRTPDFPRRCPRGSANWLTASPATLRRPRTRSTRSRPICGRTSVTGSTRRCPAAGRDAVDDFLFNSHEGFCEHFASAEAVLLRSVGVPARLVTGFVDGQQRGTRRVFRGTDAHAWVQVNVGGEHWAFTDPTAGATIAPPHHSRARRVRHAVGEHWRLALGSVRPAPPGSVHGRVCTRGAYAARAPPGHCLLGRRPGAGRLRPPRDGAAQRPAGPLARELHPRAVGVTGRQLARWPAGPRPGPRRAGGRRTGSL